MNPWEELESAVNRRSIYDPLSAESMEGGGNTGPRRSMGQLGKKDQDRTTAEWVGTNGQERVTRIRETTADGNREWRDLTKGESDLLSQYFKELNRGELSITEVLGLGKPKKAAEPEAKPMNRADEIVAKAGVQADRTSRAEEIVANANKRSLRALRSPMVPPDEDIFGEGEDQMLASDDSATESISVSSTAVELAPELRVYGGYLQVRCKKINLVLSGGEISLALTDGTWQNGLQLETFECPEEA